MSRERMHTHPTLGVDIGRQRRDSRVQTGQKEGSESGVRSKREGSQVRQGQESRVFHLKSGEPGEEGGDT